MTARAPSGGPRPSHGIGCRKQGGQPQDGVSRRFWRLGKTTKANDKDKLPGRLLRHSVARNQNGGPVSFIHWLAFPPTRNRADLAGA